MYFGYLLRVQYYLSYYHLKYLTNRHLMKCMLKKKRRNLIVRKCAPDPLAS